jgi:hypothetical protein
MIALWTYKNLPHKLNPHKLDSQQHINKVTGYSLYGPGSSQTHNLEVMVAHRQFHMHLVSTPFKASSHEMQPCLLTPHNQGHLLPLETATVSSRAAILSTVCHVYFLHQQCAILQNMESVQHIYETMINTVTCNDRHFSSVCGKLSLTTQSQ